MTTTNGNLLEVRDLRTYFSTEDGEVKAVDGISFQLKRGETLGIVGESGSGKSVTNLSIIRLIPSPPGRIVSGQVLFDGVDILALKEADVRRIRGRRIAMIFQDPMTSLNPFMKISRQLMEITELHLGHTKRQAYDHAVEMLETVGIPDARTRVDNYPHEFSGGMRQRVMIVMYAGKVFEQAPTAELFASPGNPYTKGLLRSVPDPTAKQGKLYQIPGAPPDVAHLPAGCPFAPRCQRAEDLCSREFPPFVQLTAEHFSLCHFADEVYEESKAEARP